MTRFPGTACLWCRTLEQPAPTRRRRQIEDHWLRGLDRRCAGVHDFEQRETVERFVPHLEHESRTIAEHDRAALRRACGLFGVPAPRASARAGSVATSATRMPPVAGTVNSCDSSRSPSTVVVACTLRAGLSPVNSARPASFVFADKRRRSAGQLDRLAGNHIRDCTRERPGRSRCRLEDRQRAAACRTSGAASGICACDGAGARPGCTRIAA